MTQADQLARALEQMIEVCGGGGPVTMAAREALAAYRAQADRQGEAVEKLEELAHRIAWRYKKSSDPHHSDTYTFNKDTLIQFAAEIGKEKSK